RAPLERLPRLARLALEEARIDPSALTGIAVTRAPGLVGSLVVGVAFAKALGVALGVPVTGVNHVEAHLHAGTLEHGESPLPAVALVVSGGHTELGERKGFRDYRWLGSTRDDAVGEAFDKVAKLLGLVFPGGPAIEKIAAHGNRSAFAFPRPMLDQPGFDFSFSGLKTAVALAVNALRDDDARKARAADLAASFQAAAIDALAGKTAAALDHTRARALNLGGGVAANRALRERLGEICAARGVALRMPSMRLCADNAAMIALVGAWQLERGLEV